MDTPSEEEIMSNDKLRVSEYLLAHIRATEGTPAAAVVSIIEQITQQIDVSPPDGLLAAAVTIAVNAEAMKSARDNYPDSFAVTFNRSGNRETIIRSIELMEHALKTMKMAVQQ